ncbi:MAG: hypothetical protein KDC12_09110, partial [Flavobacteriales bacterium]|nr:hypothetical protein [Flavobacteriales bacterium]
MRVGVIDCGTNTFNILIAEFHNGGHEILFSTKIAVKLAPSIDTNMIGSNRFGRGLDALLVHKNILENYQTERVYLFATSAIRDSANGKAFVKQVKEALNFDIHVIGGDEEAELIYEGVIQDIQLEENVDLIMDIGGGSVEFILAHVHGILWKRSFPIGVSRLKGMFMPSDPMTEEESGKIQEFLFGALEPLFEEIGKH